MILADHETRWFTGAKELTGKKSLNWIIELHDGKKKERRIVTDLIRARRFLKLANEK